MTPSSGAADPTAPTTPLPQQRSGSAHPAAPGGTRPGRTEFGRIDISAGTVAKLAARAASEIPDAGAAAPRVLGRTLDAAPAPGVRRTSLGAAPKTSADVDGSLARLRLVISVRWPASVPSVVAAVRRHVAERVTELTGLSITEIDIEVTDLVARLDKPRVR